MRMVYVYVLPFKFRYEKYISNYRYGDFRKTYYLKHFDLGLIWL
jgi:hypothetical protein